MSNQLGLFNAELLFDLDAAPTNGVSAPVFSRHVIERVSQAAFDAYDAANPAIYAKLAEFALQARRSGSKHVGIGMLYERLRWFTQIESKNDTFKLNNNYRAFYARKLMQDFPNELLGVFETRTSKADYS